jgi:hypothetical protein
MTPEQRDTITAAIDGSLAPYLRDSRHRGQLVAIIGATFEGALEHTDLVLVSRTDLDTVINRAGDPASLATYPAAMQHIQDAIKGGDRG